MGGSPCRTESVRDLRRPRGLALPEQIEHPLFARLWDRICSKESKRMRAFRARLLSKAGGRVVELGPGNGPNFALYSPAVEEVVAVEPEPYLRTQAERAAREAAVQIRVVDGRAEAIPVEDGWADAVVCTLMLCSVEDQVRALAEIKRVLRPGGELLLFEHVGTANPVGQACLRAAEVTFWRRAFGNCQPTRHTLEAVAAAGFDTSDIEHLMQPFPPLPHIVGVAPAR